MIALSPIIALLIQFGPAIITLLAQILQAAGGPATPMTDHPLIAGLISGLFLPHPVTKRVE